ncbi:hypothetical protein VQH23_00430 [Pararoseomonas sp. SCSIO 73927]|uniref:hypothetical protein n=1 Tax=Pararoseomonas sp. SCSIO 73927 TaxID=3114537 RepID=UPI0030D20355
MTVPEEGAGVDGAALRRAELLADRARDAEGAERRALAEQALAVSPFCADAHIIFAGEAPRGSEAALEGWRRAVEAGRAAIGPMFEAFRGEFWAIDETRPYMRARHGLALALWERGEREAAIGQLREMLALGPEDDDLGVRHLLAAWLVEAGRDSEAAAVLDEYPDDPMAARAWTAALLAFRRDGDSAGSRRLLAGAMAANPDAAEFLSGRRALPDPLPVLDDLGGEAEAAEYAALARGAWAASPGALDWLRKGTGAAGGG